MLMHDRGRMRAVTKSFHQPHEFRLFDTGDIRNRAHASTLGAMAPGACSCPVTPLHVLPKDHRWRHRHCPQNQQRIPHNLFHTRSFHRLHCNCRASEHCNGARRKTDIPKWNNEVIQRHQCKKKPGSGTRFSSNCNIRQAGAASSCFCSCSNSSSVLPSESRSTVTFPPPARRPNSSSSASARRIVS